MEDRHIVSTSLGGHGSSALLAVFDGHRGPQARLPCKSCTLCASRQRVEVGNETWTDSMSC